MDDLVRAADTSAPVDTQGLEGLLAILEGGLTMPAILDTVKWWVQSASTLGSTPG